MNKVAIKKIGFTEQNEYNDIWQQPSPLEPPQRGSQGQTVRWFDTLDQGAATLEENISQSSDGSYYESRLSFSLRTVVEPYDGVAHGVSVLIG